MSSFQNLLLKEIKQVMLVLHCQSLEIRLSESLLWHLITVLVSDTWKKNYCSFVCALYMEEGKENWRNMGDAFK